MRNPELTSLLHVVVSAQVYPRRQGGVSKPTDPTRQSHSAGYQHLLLQQPLPSPSCP